MLTTGGHAEGDLLYRFTNVTGGLGNDILIGNTVANILNGGAGNDTLIGGAGGDMLEGGAGIDTVDYSGNADVSKGITVTLLAAGVQAFVMGTAINAVGDKVRDIENVIGGAGVDKITGNALANKLEGGGGDDTLDGGAGADDLIGGIGNDTYVVDNAGDQISEGLGQGSDQILSSVSYAIAAGQEIEKLTLTGIAAINGTGNEFDNTITGNAGANVLEGGAGNDILDGAAGIDTLSYAGDNVGVTVTLNGANPATLSGAGSHAEGDTAKNFENLLGGSGDDELTGDATANVIEGGVGNDTLSGGAQSSDSRRHRQLCGVDQCHGRSWTSGRWRSGQHRRRQRRCPLRLREHHRLQQRRHPGRTAMPTRSKAAAAATT